MAIQSINRRLTCTVIATEVWQPLWHHTESLPRSLIRNPLLQQTPMHDVVIKWCCQPQFITAMSWFSAGGPLAAKRIIHGSHSWSGRPSTATQFAVVRGDQLWRRTTAAWQNACSYAVDNIAVACTRHQLLFVHFRSYRLPDGKKCKNNCMLYGSTKVLKQ